MSRRLVGGLVVLLLAGGLARAPAQAQAARPPQMSISPEGTLVHGQRVVVSGTGFLPGEELLLFQHCYSGPGGCGASVVADPAGQFVAEYRVHDVVDVYHGHVDCRGVGRCTLSVMTPDTWLIRAQVPLTFAPESDESVAVHPTSGLESGDVVRVDASGLNLGHPLEVNQCVAISPDTPFFADTRWACAGPPQRLAVDGAGEVHTTLRVQARWSSTTGAHPTPFDCRIDQCRVVVGGDGLDVYTGSTATGSRTYWHVTPVAFATESGRSAPSAVPSAVTPAFTG